MNFKGILSLSFFNLFIFINKNQTCVRLFTTFVHPTQLTDSLNEFF